MSVVGGVSLIQLQEDIRAFVVNTQQNAVPVNNAMQVGDWGYLTGVDGDVTLPAGAKVLQITAVATSVSDGALSINHGPDILIPSGSGISIEPKGNLISPTISFAYTRSFFVEYVV